MDERRILKMKLIKAIMMIGNSIHKLIVVMNKYNNNSDGIYIGVFYQLH